MIGSDWRGLWRRGGVDGGSRYEMVYVDGHQPPRLDILGGESGMMKKGTTKERDETTCARRGAGGAKDKPIRGKLLGTEEHVVKGAVHFLEVEGIDTGEEFGEESKLAGVEVGNESVKSAGVPGPYRKLGGGSDGPRGEGARIRTSRWTQRQAQQQPESAR